MLYTALIFGLLGSFHCIGMCGPIALLLPVDRSNEWKKLSQIFLYHFGRILAYASIGLLFGAVGKGLYLFGMQQQLSIIIGILMIIIVLIPHKTFNKYNFSKPLYKAISKIKSSLGAALKKKTPDTFFTIGFINGFLPCGLVYMAVFGAIASATAAEGSLYMAFFGLGTIPLMTAAVYFGNFVTVKIRHYIRKSIPVFVVIMGCLFVVRGLGLGIPYLSPKTINTDVVETQYECHPTSLQSSLIK